MRSRISFALLLSIFAFASPGWAASPTIRDGSTLQLGNVTYRLDGIDAPAFDQFCIDEHADSWTCGIEARDQLTKLIDGRQVRCDDLGADPTYKKRHLGLCTVEGEKTSLNQSMVRLGYALNLEPAAKGRFAADEGKARESRLGLWKAASSRRASSASGARMAPCSAAHAAPTATAKSAPPCSPKIS